MPATRRCRGVPDSRVGRSAEGASPTGTLRWDSPSSACVSPALSRGCVPPYGALIHLGGAGHARDEAQPGRTSPVARAALRREAQ
jgi:hypothetical protein